MKHKSSSETRVLYALARFANCGDGLDEYERLATEMPDFWPAEVRDAGGRSLAWRPGAHRIFLAFRDAVRRVWTHEAAAKRDGVPGFLLGLAKQEYAAKASPAFARAIDALGADVHFHAGVCADLSTLRLVYTPETKFTAAVWALLQQPWRSRVCPECQKFYVARKLAQKYCGDECQHEARKRQFREAWARSGSKRRAAKKAE
jgi:hypothetical protein